MRKHPKVRDFPRPPAPAREFVQHDTEPPLPFKFGDLRRYLKFGRQMVALLDKTPSAWFNKNPQTGEVFMALAAKSELELTEMLMTWLAQRPEKYRPR